MRMFVKIKSYLGGGDPSSYIDAPLIRLESVLETPLPNSLSQILYPVLNISPTGAPPAPVANTLGSAFSPMLDPINYSIVFSMFKQ